MAISCPIDLNTQKLREEIQSIYARVATDPSGEFHFHRGPQYAAEFLNYDSAALDRLPLQSTASFAGVANPHRMGPIGKGAVVADIGCGAGMDLLLAATDVGKQGRAIGIDMTESMREKALSSARIAGLENVEVRLGDAMSLPLADETFDVVISNGVLNLVPDKLVAYSEVLRILKPGGRFLYADIAVGSELSESIRRNVDLWTG
jgi:ubiquinone/menaquinone biosynthesis C-methylase UbiE